MPHFTLTDQQHHLLVSALRVFASGTAAFENEIQIACDFDDERRCTLDVDDCRKRADTLADEVAAAGQAFTLSFNDADIAYAALWHAIGNQYGIDRRGDAREHDMLDTAAPATRLFITMAVQSRQIEVFADKPYFSRFGFQDLTGALADEIGSANNPLFREYSQKVVAGEMNPALLRQMIARGLKLDPFDLEQHEWKTDADGSEFTRYEFHTSLLEQAIAGMRMDEIRMLLDAGADPLARLHCRINNEETFRNSAFSNTLSKADTEPLATLLEYSDPMSINTMHELFHAIYQNGGHLPAHLEAHADQDFPKTVSPKHHAVFAAFAAKRVLQTILDKRPEHPEAG